MKARKICISIIFEDDDLLQISGYIAKYYTKDKIILIDPDAYKIVNYEKERLKIANKKELMKLFKSIYLHFVKNGSDCKNIYDLFYIKVNEKTNVTYEISKKLTKKRP